MNRRTRLGLVGAGLAALLAPLGLALTTTAAEAGSPTTHQLRYYNVQKDVRIPGEFPDNEPVVILACGAGDFAVDGNWTVDHVDDLNPDAGIEYGDERDVLAVSSTGYDSFVNRWYFKFVNGADGDAQVTAIVTCLDNQTTDNAGHKHQLSIGERRTTTGADGAASGTVTREVAACPAGSVSVAHGFYSTTGSPRLFQSWKSATDGWYWSFQNVSTTETTNVSTYDRCLSLKTKPAGNGGHVHRLTATFAPQGAAAVPVTLPASQRTERLFTCAVHNSFVAAGSVYLTDPGISYYLGTSPRGRTHANRFWNTAAAPGSYVGGLCLTMRTGKQVRP